MRTWPRSLFGRLLGIATLATLAALVFAGFAISNVLERFVMHGLDDRLDAQVSVLARAVRPDGTLDRARIVTLPRFDEPGSGWQWSVRDGAGRQWSSSPDPRPVATRPDPPRRPHRGGDRDDHPPRPGEGVTATGEAVHLRQISIDTPAGPVSITASGPRRIVQAPLREAMLPLLASLALLGAGLGVATLVQLRFGLRPLRTIKAALADVRVGRQRHVPADQPSELQPLVQELNALIDQNEAGLAHARRHVSNLAHGLKTPLAALGLKLAEPGRDPDGTMTDMVARIDDQIRHHLGRARAAAPGGMGRTATPVAPAVADLIAVLARIHVERGIAASVDIPADLLAAADPQDLDEMLGNVLDNAWRHARGMVSIRAARDGGTVRIAIDDDGPGLDQEAIGEALVPGRRLDERGDGHGFGLPITQELAELNGGMLTLARSPVTSGLRVVLTLPGRAADPVA